MRLNGFFTLPNFILHADVGSPQRTEFDTIAVRFPYRAELHDSPTPLSDLGSLIGSPTLAQCVLVDATTATCKLSSAWEDLGNLTAWMQAIGILRESEWTNAAQSLRDARKHVADGFEFRFIAIGQKTNKHLHGAVQQYSWAEVLHWIFGRMNAYEEQKRHNSQWPSIGRLLYRTAIKNASTPDVFVRRWLLRMGVAAPSGATQSACSQSSHHAIITGAGV